MKLKLIFAFLTVISLTTARSANPRGVGYPEKDPAKLFEKFCNPPRGYGNVPFYWWNGDALSKERMADQLKVLSEAAIDGFAVSYAHTDPRIDTALARNGYGFAGNTEPGSPEVFSEKWWEFWKWYSAECAKYGLASGMDDYTYGWPGNGYYPDQVKNLPEFASYQGTLKIDATDAPAGADIETRIPDNCLSVVAWPGQIDLSNKVSGGVLRWRVPEGPDCKVYVVSTENGYALHPEHGHKLVDLYFDEFERRLTPEQFRGINYFFQDELTHPVSRMSWSEDFAEEFIRRKGYDVRPYLAALTTDIGPETPRIRLDYCDVQVDLLEERYFKPIYEWHASRNLIYGSDNHGRGKDPLAYVDYFRANSWYTAPGNDAPSNGSSFIETKVSSSISHLYNRPRTWLEAFHSMGWGSNGAWLTRQIDHHFIAGGNLVCMHGLYYSTHGGWWEWAPPDFHFRMPYWPHMKRWLEYTRRMSYLLSQGTHVCDIAVMYPTESMQAYPDATPSAAFSLAMELSNHGLDYDFMHYKHLQNAAVKDGDLTVGDETYKVLILADLLACHHSTLRKAVEHYRNGGIVVATGALPRATTLSGEGSAEVAGMLEELFGTQLGVVHRNATGGVAAWLEAGEVPAFIGKSILPDFAPSRDTGKVLHRRIGHHNVYMVTDVEQGDTCFFRATGHAELWDAESGSRSELPVVGQDDKGTRIAMNREKGKSYLIVFSPGKPAVMQREAPMHLVRTVPLAGEWEVEYVPTMNNKWGDYRLPASDEMIGPEAPVFNYRKAGTDNGWTSPGYDDSAWRRSVWGYGIQMESLSLDASCDFQSAADRILTGSANEWRPYEFSWKLGVWDNPGSQGFHGLKGRVDDGFLILADGGHRFFRTYAVVSDEGDYKTVVHGRNPDLLHLDGQPVGADKPHRLKAGRHELLIGYADTPNTPYQRSPFDFDPRVRSMVTVFPATAVVPQKTEQYDREVSSAWGQGGHLLYSPYDDDTNRWQFRAETVPGVREIGLSIYGTLTGISLAGETVPQECIALEPGSDGVSRYRVTLPTTHPQIETLALEIDAAPGYTGMAAFAEPVKFTCGKGELSAGNWAEQGSLLYYSGGMIYRKSVDLASGRGQKTELALGNVLATCEVRVNGRVAAVLIAPPYTVDISDYIRKGRNEIEVLVYSTLSNHYQTIPSIYRGHPDAGLIGPATIEVREKKDKR